MTKYFWNAAVFSVYIYTITILTQFGYNSYFNIPPSFIDASINSNTIYIYALLRAIIQLIISLGYWLFLLIPIGFLFYFFYKKHVIKIVTAILIFAALFVFYDFGFSIAKNTTKFLVPSVNCAQLLEGKDYIVPVIYDAKLALMVPIDKDNKINGIFAPMDITELSCGLEYRDIGKIIK